MRFDTRAMPLLVLPWLLAGHVSDAGLPLQPVRTIEFDTSEATWMSLDVSPDGNTIVFDLLGDLYVVGVDGGKATAITRGLAFDTQPAFSPDGSKILFVSDRSGAENFWVIDVDGSAARQVSANTGVRMYLSPSWSADGATVYGSIFRADRNAYELWSFDADRTGPGRIEVPGDSTGKPQRGDLVSALGATASPDGRYLYFARHVGALDTDLPAWTIQRRDLASGEDMAVVQPAERRRRDGYVGSFFRPEISPDGRYLVYASRYRGKTGLRIRDLSDGADRWLAYPLQRDQLQATSVQDLVPGFAFAPDGTAVIVGYDGGMARVSLAGEVSTIAFDATVKLELGPELRVDVAQETGPVRARLIQHPEPSPDGGSLAFSALGRIYVQSLADDRPPRPLVDLPRGQFHPSWSPDGRDIVFVSWTDSGGGQVWVAPADGAGVPERLTSDPAFYTHPVFAPDADAIIVVRSRQADRMDRYMEFGLLREASLVSIPRQGGVSRDVLRAEMGGKPHFAENPDNVILAFEDGLNTVDLETGERQNLLSASGHGWYFREGPGQIDEIRISPNGKWALARSAAQQLHLFAVPDAAGVTVDLTDAATVQRQLTTVGADFFDWSDSGDSISWALGSTFYRCTPSLSAAPDCRLRESFEIVVEVPRDTPSGTLVLRGATVITMNGESVIENADVVVESDRIAAVGPRGNVDIPEGSEIQSLEGRFVVPGFIDVHCHLADIRRDVLAMSSWGAAANLAYGVTTSFDPSSLSIDMLAYEDLIDAGLIVGSRIHSTGPAIFSFHDFQNLQEVEEVLRRYLDFYRTRNVKMYRSGNRQVREWVAMAAGNSGLMPTTEGALAMKLGLTQVLDGFAGLEHELAALPLGDDIVELIARSGVAYTPTLIISAGPDAQDFFITRDDPSSDPKLARFWPASVIDMKLRSTTWHAPGEYSFPIAAEGATRILRAGGIVGVGAHGNIPGLGYHWELQALTKGGMQAMEALRAATILSARAIGREREFGSIEPGKYADLVVLERDPRDDVVNLQSISLVMKNGRLYDGDTLDEVWPRRRTFPEPWHRNDLPVARSVASHKTVSIEQ